MIQMHHRQILVKIHLQINFHYSIKLIKYIDKYKPINLIKIMDFIQISQNILVNRDLEGINTDMIADTVGILSMKQAFSLTV